MSLFLFARHLRPAAAGLAILAMAVTLARAASAPAGASPPAASGTAYVTGFSQPGFAEDGLRAWLIEGRRAQTAANDTSVIQITGMKLTRFTHAEGSETLNLESTIECANATVHTDKTTNQTTVTSPEKLYIYDGANNSYNATGDGWTWDGNAARMMPAPLTPPESLKPVIHIDRNVYVKFTAEASVNPSPTAGNAAPAQPVVILSDTLDIYQLAGQNRFVFTGNITVTNGETQTTCHWLEVLAQSNSGPAAGSPATAQAATAPVNLGVGHVERIMARDSVVVLQNDPKKGDFRASGGQAVINPGDQSVILTESPQIRAAASDTILQGGRITWKQNQQVMLVDPPEGAPGRVSVSMPPLSSYQKDAPAPIAGGPRLVITGESMTAQFEQGQQTFNIEKSVHVEDPDLKVNADHLDANFLSKADSTTPAPVATPSIAISPASANSLPPMGKLNHLTVSGNATILQGNLTTTTPRAEIMPAAREIDFNAGAHIMDGRSHAEIDGGRISLFNDGQNGTIESTPGRPATIFLPAMRASAVLGGANAPTINTTVMSDSVLMQRGDDQSTFTFDNNVHITASDYDSTCGQMIVTTNNLAAKPGDDALMAPAKFGQIIELQEINHVVVSQGAFKAFAASAEVYPQAKIAPGAADAPAGGAPAPAYRLVQLHGDPKGINGPVRPEVDIVLSQSVDVSPLVSGRGAAPAKPGTKGGTTTAKITSDEQWLMTNPVSGSPDEPAANAYYFNGNVKIDADTFIATSDRMRAEASPAKDAAGGGKYAVDRIVVEDKVTFKQDTNFITANHAIIVPDKDTVTMTDTVKGRDSATGQAWSSEHVIYNLKTQDVMVDTPPAKPGETVKRPTFVFPAGTATKH